jgi:hypothetical protein
MENGIQMDREKQYVEGLKFLQKSGLVEGFECKNKIIKMF